MPARIPLSRIPRRPLMEKKRLKKLLKKMLKLLPGLLKPTSPLLPMILLLKFCCYLMNNIFG
jgi:hypothetical protein